jgi:hypothetical protein|tara:strand:+ start:1911 stop:2687 length:777 start_codon:yes stop_codon:yes gene_type:complete
MDHVKEAYSHYSEARQASNEYFSLAAKSDSSINSWLVRPWYLFYELDLAVFNSVMTEIMGIREDLGTLKSPSLEELLKLIERGMSHLESVLDELSNSEQSDESDVIFMIQLAHAIGFNFTAIEQRHRTINEMLKVVRLNNQHSEGALLEAVYTDRSALGCPTIQQHISLAQISDNNSFMHKLSKAITRTKPTRKERAYDPMRYLLEIIAETRAKQKVSTKELSEVCLELGLFTEGKDPLSAIAKFNQKRNKVKKEPKS